MILHQEVNWDDVPYEFRQPCPSCEGQGDEVRLVCHECDSRGWTLIPLQDVIDSYKLLQYSSKIPTIKKYWGWITVEPDKDGEKRYRFTAIESLFNEPAYYVLGALLIKVERFIGKPFDIEENLGTLGAFKVYTMEETQ